MKKSAMVLVLIAGFVFLAGGAFAAPPVKIGVDDVRSGPFKSNGDIALLGLETAVHQINKSGGLLGRQVDLVIEDNQMNPEIAIQKLKKMILEDKVEAVFQQSSSTVGFAITQTIPRYKKLFICQGASSMDFTGAKFNPYMFHTTANSVQYIRGQAAYLGKERKYKKIFLVCLDNTLGHEVAVLYEKFIKEASPDVQIVGREFCPVFTKDFAPYISKIKASGADYVFSTNWGTDLVQLLKQSRTMGLTMPIAAMLIADATTLPIVGDAAIGSLGASFMMLGTGLPKAKPFEEAFYKEAKTWPVEQIYQGWSAMTMYAEAVKRAHSFDTDKVIKAWEGFEWDGPYGKVLMRAQDHQAMMPIFVGKIEGKTKYFDFPYFTYLMTVTREQLDYKAEDYGWKPYKGK